VAPLEPWEKVLVDSDAFSETVHGHVACTDCHNGVQDPNKDRAHENLIAIPSEDSERACGECHPNVTAVFPLSLHVSQEGYWTVINERSVPEDHAALEEMFGNHCSACHTTCGDCHVSQPRVSGGGFIDGHVFNASPSMTRNCTACHGSRVGNEYLGKHEGIKADVHFRQGRMKCTDCHTDHEMHGEMVNCDDCHAGSENVSVRRRIIVTRGCNYRAVRPAIPPRLPDRMDWKCTRCTAATCLARCAIR